MRNLISMAIFEIKDAFRGKWFYIYFVIFFGLMGGFLWSGITASQVLGFTGLTRVLIGYIEITIVILPLFILISASRSVVMERELFILEYLVSFPVSITQYYWGKFIGRFIVIVIPIYTAFLFSVIWGMMKHFPVPWHVYGVYTGLVAALSLCFLGISYFISSLSQRQDTAIFTAFFVWFFFVVLLDVGILGLFLKFGISLNLVLAMALANPLELFRIAAFSLFDVKLAVIGPIAWTLLGKVGNNGLILISYIYPIFMGLFIGFIGLIYFKNNDFI